MFNEAYEANFVEISRQVLRQNAKAVTDYVKVPVIGVVKFDGYGMGIAEAARAWQSAGVTMFAVSESWEALALRREGFTEDILLMAPVADREVLTQLLEKDIILTVSNLDNAWFYRQGCGEYTPRVHVKVDTGMGRFGVRWTDTQQLKDIYDMKELRFEGIFSHFGKSFEKNYKLTAQQLERFRTAVKALTEAGIDVGMRHIANSCAALRFPETRLDAVRIGSALVGRLPASTPVKLENVSIFKAQVVDCKTLLPGDTTGYGGVCRVKKLTQAIVVAVGREDGLGLLEHPGALTGIPALKAFLRLLLRAGTRPTVSHKGNTLPMLGRVGQQYTLFDATGLSIRPGDYVTLDLPQLFPGRVIRYTDI